MMKKNLLIAGAMLLIMTAFSFRVAQAQTCVVPPTCEELGYNKTASDCDSLAKLRCPFDASKYFCTTSQTTLQTYKVGDIYMKDGVALGTVAEVDSTGKHGYIILEKGMLQSSQQREAIQDCKNLQAGGMIWSLAKCSLSCKLGKRGLTIDCGKGSCRCNNNYGQCYSGDFTLSYYCSAQF